VGNPNFARRCRSWWRGVECDLLNDDGVFIAKGQVIAYDPMEVVLDDWFGEDHVGLCIMYCLGIVSMVMTIWKWPLSWTILDGYFLQKHLVKYNEDIVPNADEVGVVSVRKKQYTFHKRKWGSSDSEGATSKMDKVLSKEFVKNVNFFTCYGMNCS
jgi:hypothetical protein